MDNVRRPPETATPLVAAQMLVRVTGLVLIVLGVLFWTDRALWLVPAHSLVGLLFVLALWTVALLASRAGASTALALVAFLWGLALPVLGLTQDRLLAGGAHWLVQVVHLLAGVAAIGLAEALAGAARRAGPASGEPAS